MDGVWKCDHQRFKRQPYQEKQRHCVLSCGASSNKPFCDGSHKTIGFEG
ncbi:MAG: CDGSH iron-sulfur domain-containing protein [Flammeovirgaceae bacterium]